MALQQALAASLRSGFLSLAQARYSMGAERVSVLQLPSHMSATTRLRVSGGCPRKLLLLTSRASSLLCCYHRHHQLASTALLLQRMAIWIWQPQSPSPIQQPRTPAAAAAAMVAAAAQVQHARQKRLPALQQPCRLKAARVWRSSCSGCG
jgi:hypothetical protein